MSVSRGFNQISTYCGCVCVIEGDGYFSGETGDIRSYDGQSVLAVPNALLANWIVTQCKREPESTSQKLN